MEVSFEEHEVYTELTAEEKIAFYHKMKQVVVYVESFLDESKITMRTGGGVLLSCNGHVITSAHLIENSGTDLFFSLQDGERVAADVVDVDFSKDLAVIKPKREFCDRVFNFAKFGEVSRCTVGARMVTIHNRVVHPRDLPRNVLVVGYLAFPADDLSEVGRYRSVGPLISGANDPTKFAKYDRNLNIMQIANFKDAVTGGAVFDSQGRVVGVLAFRLHGFYFAVHLDVVKRFFEKVISTEKSKAEEMEKR
ncbi:hypothetical protein ACHQM5_021287 [Ranunculus cassubicifolius]